MRQLRKRLGRSVSVRRSGGNARDLEEAESPPNGKVSIMARLFSTASVKLEKKLMVGKCRLDYS